MSLIKVLPPAVAKKIAAGEVIDRPASVLRELLDNAIDAHATEIEIKITEGGLKSIEVRDNGEGMSPEDLALSILPHATGKIRKAEDLYHLTSLGFRGEALPSIAACSRLQIISKTAGGNGHQITAEGGEKTESVPFPAANGTEVRVSDLFYSIPGRKKFMKSPQGEAAACLHVFFDKAAAFPDIAFRYGVDNRLKYFLPVQSPLERLQYLYRGRLDTQFLKAVHSTPADADAAAPYPLSVSFITSTPSVYRHDRKNIQIFVNKRRITEFALVQAIEYGYRELLPGGCFPVSFAFIQIDPSKVDFNIHPAKKEVKFADIPAVRQLMIQMLKAFLAPFSLQLHSVYELRETAAKTGQANLAFPPPSFHPPAPSDASRTPNPAPAFGAAPAFSGAASLSPTAPAWVHAPLPAYAPSPDPGCTAVDPHPPSPSLIPPETPGAPIRYLGSFQNLFLIVTQGNRIYMIDQHAAHERILFNRFSALSNREALLIPLPIDDPFGKGAALFSAKQLESLAEIGVDLRFSETEGWRIFAVPLSVYSFSENLANLLPELPEDGFELKKRLFATLSCRSAVKEGDCLSPEKATAIAEAALALPNPHCPHGRPVYFVLTMEELFQLVGRTV